MSTIRHFMHMASRRYFDKAVNHPNPLIRLNFEIHSLRPGAIEKAAFHCDRPRRRYNSANPKSSNTLHHRSSVLAVEDLAASPVLQTLLIIPARVTMQTR
ncbi:hypothetical protein O3G_MSEX012581 [Manduca sexta]|uniref:Uncharacterized protein n=1 Tax=Manduca sexta TaxID=7130 RepID=A0A921ZNL1_MANSE|nr:hypothetical protein O3G_MSEX012581 [Manduca sexta]